MTQFYDVYDRATGQFILRAELPAISRLYNWRHCSVEYRIKRGPDSIDIYGDGRHEDLTVKRVTTDWTPSSI